MKKKFLSLLLAICMIIPCAFTLTACGKCEHNWVLSMPATLNSVGKLVCTADCYETKELPALNETDYVVDSTNPDYKIYTYNIDGQSFRFFGSNFVVYSHYVSLPDGGYEYDGAEILKYTGNSTNVVIPEEIEYYIIANNTYSYNKYAITCITTNFANAEPYYAFQNNTTVTSIVLPSTIKEIEKYAFNGCTNLQSLYYKGSKSQWDNLKISNSNSTDGCFDNASVYYYSETQPSVADYIESDYTLNTWHYNENNDIDLWIKYTNNVENKSFTYSHSEVSLSDTYWLMLKEAERQGMLGDLFDNDQEQIEMVTSSATKAEYETKFATWYGTTIGTEAVTSFADGKATVTLMGNSMQTDYIEINGEVWYTSSKEKAFAFDTTNNSIYAEQSNDYYTIRHIYSIVE